MRMRGEARAAPFGHGWLPGELPGAQALPRCASGTGQAGGAAPAHARVGVAGVPPVARARGQAWLGRAHYGPMGLRMIR